MASATFICLEKANSLYRMSKAGSVLLIIHVTEMQEVKI